MKQYFQENYDLPNDEVEIRKTLFGYNFLFLSKRGLFSYNEIDDNSLTLIENIQKPKGSLLDLGCGFGAVGIILAKVYGIKLTGCDINRVAIEMAKKNASINEVFGDFIHSDCFNGVTGCFDTIVLNPPIHAGKEVVYKMYTKAKEHLKIGGAFYIVINKKHGALTSLCKLAELYDECTTVYKKKGTYVIECKTCGG